MNGWEHMNGANKRDHVTLNLVTNLTAHVLPLLPFALVVFLKMAREDGVQIEDDFSRLARCG